MAGVVEELAEIIGARLNALGLNPIAGIVYQIAPDYDPKSGTLLHGVAKHPFVSISHVLPEQPNFAESTNTSMMIVRVLTLAIIADKTKVEPAPDVYSHYRDRAIKALHTFRGTGTLSSISNACIMHATVRPNSPIQQSAWQNSAKFVSTFDVLFQTEEPTGIIT